MNTAPLLSRITISPDICHGRPCIRGLRYPVEFVRELLSSGMTEAEVLTDYPDLVPEDLAAVRWLETLRRRKSEMDSGAVPPVPGETMATEVSRAVQQVRGA